MLKTALTAIVATIGLTGAALAGTGTGAPADVLERLQAVSDGSFQMAQSCSGGSKYCYPGSIAGGGCYNPAYSRCWEGMICPNGQRICTVDQKGYPTPYCYDPSLPNTCRQ